MISLILPYWDRQEAADKALALLAEHYRHLDLEVIVVDDGNAVPFVTPASPLNIRVVRLPLKSAPTPQSKAWNAGVEAASGDIIVLSCIEVRHETPVLEEMRKALTDRNSYVLAAAYCPDIREWQCHSENKWFDLPEGIGPAFLGMMHKDLFYRAGGFDEAYHEGAGYEDRDFARRMLRAGAVPLIRDDLVVIHPKRGASIAWPAEGFLRNEVLYRSKWLKQVTFLCLKAGSAYGPEYVNILFDMVRRNLSEGYPGRFVCLTDDPAGIAPGVEVMPLLPGLDGWWGKLYMFKRGLFRDGERVVFMDLDTLVIGNIDALAGYGGQFATLRDFYYPQQVGPAIIAWEVGDLSASIWDEWDACGRPRDGHGDLWWINGLDQGNFVKRIDILQDKLPGMFCSFKANCRPYPPKGTAVVCFHGQPKPHNCTTEWVADVWKEGGSGMAELESVSNTARDVVSRNVISSSLRHVPWLEIAPEHKRQAVIVAGGPSLESSFPEIEWRASMGQAVIAVNGSAAWLNERHITPDIHVVIDARPENARFLASTSHQQFLASQCAPETFDAAGAPVLFHLNTEGIAQTIPGDREAHLISSGSTGGLAAMAIAYTQGYRTMHLHGFDSSVSEGHHAYDQPQNDDDALIDVVVEGRRFKAAPWMVKQAQEFQELALQLADAGCVITVAGDGLLPFVASCMSAGPKCH